MADVTVTGLEELQAKLLTLGGAAANRAAASAIRAGMAVIARAERAAAPVGKTGAIRKSIGSRFLRKTKKGLTEAKAGLNVGKRKKGKRAGIGYAPHASFVALGTQPRWAGVKYGYTRKRGQRSVYNPDADTLTGKPLRYTGVMPASDFIARSAAAAEPEAIRRVEQKLGEQILKEAAKMGGAA